MLVLLREDSKNVFRNIGYLIMSAFFKEVEKQVADSAFHPTSEPTANKDLCTCETQIFKSLEEMAGPCGT